MQRVCEVKLGEMELKNSKIVLLEKKDVFAFLLTGFGKSVIYQSYSLAKSEIDAVSLAVIVIVLLREFSSSQALSTVRKHT